MLEKAKWIWVSDHTEEDFYIVHLKKEILFDKKIKEVKIQCTGDTFFDLFLNKRHVGCGPHCAGGDYDGLCKFGERAKNREYYKNVIPKTYVNSFIEEIDSENLDIFASVRFGKVVATDTSSGKGGFILQADLIFEDGTSSCVVTDKSWKGKIESRRKSIHYADYTIEENEYENAIEIKNVWNLYPTEIPNLTEKIYTTENKERAIINPNQTKKIYFDFGKVYSAYPCFDIIVNGSVEITLEAYENRGRTTRKDTIRTNKNLHYESVAMCGCSGYVLTITCAGDDTAAVEIENIRLRIVHYPVKQEGGFVCSDQLLNDIYNAGKQALKMCRQSIHLDSPTHQENLGCTGDYYVESLMEYYAFGDTQLTRFDLVRTADLLREGEGRMFHTTYSLIYMQMLWDYYMYSGDKSIFNTVLDAVEILFSHFARYEREDGILDNLPDYMFVDWLEIDGFSLHHPPKCLGQTVLNAFYYKALHIAKDIYTMFGNHRKKLVFEQKISKLKESFFACFFDSSKGCFTSGETDKISNSLIGAWQPQNSSQKYYSVHSNALAVLYDLCPKEIEKDLMEKVLTDKSLIYPQPYFMHFVLEAINKVGLFEKYGLDTIRLWGKAIDKDKCALKEGWIPVNSYAFDLSHAWGGSPTYQLPARLLGIDMIEPGWKKIKINPCLYGLDFAEISIPTPFGMFICRMDNKETELHVPQGIEIIK